MYINCVLYSDFRYIRKMFLYVYDYKYFNKVKLIKWFVYFRIIMFLLLIVLYVVILFKLIKRKRL